jgi:hypothetical protein
MAKKNTTPTAPALTPATVAALATATAPGGVLAPTPTPAPVAPVGRAVKFGPGSVVTLLKGNPKRPGTASYARYALYGAVGSTATVEAVLAKGVTRADLTWDAQRGFISVTPA